MKFNLWQKLMHRATGREAVPVLYRPFPKPEYGVTGDVPGEVDRLWLRGFDEIDRIYEVHWVPESALESLFSDEIAGHWTGRGLSGLCDLEG